MPTHWDAILLTQAKPPDMIFTSINKKPLVCILCGDIRTPPSSRSIRKNSFFLFGCMFCGLFTSAQITVTNTTFPGLGDKLRYAIDYNPANITISPPGINYVWDWSHLQTDAQEVIEYKAASQGSRAADVPGATLYALLNGNTENYYSVSATRFDLLAQKGIVPGTPNFIKLMQFTPAITERRAPVNFFDINQISSVYFTGFQPQQFPASFFQAIGTDNVDSIRIRGTFNRIDVVNASGTLIIPGGSFPVLRETRTLYRENRLDARIPPIGWVDVTDFLVQAGGFPGLGIDTTIQYLFYSSTSKELIAEVTANFADLAVQQVRFKNIAAILPVSLIAFTALNRGKVNIVKWETAAETNSNRYELQRSAVGINFETVATIKSANNPAGSSYRYEDNISRITTGKLYYRLQMIDNDGRYTFSAVLSINIDGRAQKIVLAGNPVSRSLTVITPASLLHKPLQAEVINANGVVITKRIVSSSSTNMDVSNLAGGTYLIRFVQGGTVVQTEGFVKQ
jgi:hypothetical protein